MTTLTVRTVLVALVAIAGAGARAETKVFVDFGRWGSGPNRAAVMETLRGRFAWNRNIRFVDSAEGASAVVEFVDGLDPKRSGTRFRFGNSLKNKKKATVWIQEHLRLWGDNEGHFLKVLGETAAHELAHLLCADHNIHAPNNRVVIDDTGRQIRGDGGTPDVMTDGRFVTKDERKNLDPLDQAAQDQVAKGIRMLKDGKTWKGEASSESSIELVSGKPETMHHHDEREWPDGFVPYEDKIDVRATLEGQATMDVDFGFTNIHREFVPRLDGDALDGILTFDRDESPTFVLGGEPGSRFEGMVFHPMTIEFSDRLDGSFADAPIREYWRTVDLGFDTDNDNKVDTKARLSTADLALTHGFHPVNRPTLPRAFQVTRGEHLSGSLRDLFASDDLRVLVQARRPTEVAAASIEIEIVALSLVGTPERIELQVESSSAGSPVIQRLEMFNYRQRVWVTLDEFVPPAQDDLASVVILRNAHEFVEQATGEMRARIGIHDRGVTFVDWGGAFDMVRWVVR